MGKKINKSVLEFMYFRKKMLLKNSLTHKIVYMLQTLIPLYGGSCKRVLILNAVLFFFKCGMRLNSESLIKYSWNKNMFKTKAKDTFMPLGYKDEFIINKLLSSYLVNLNFLSLSNLNYLYNGVNSGILNNNLKSDIACCSNYDFSTSPDASKYTARDPDEEVIRYVISGDFSSAPDTFFYTYSQFGGNVSRKTKLLSKTCIKHYNGVYDSGVSKNSFYANVWCVFNSIKLIEPVDIDSGVNIWDMMPTMMHTDIGGNWHSNHEYLCKKHDTIRDTSKYLSMNIYFWCIKFIKNFMKSTTSVFTARRNNSFFNVESDFLNECLISGSSGMLTSKNGLDKFSDLNLFPEFIAKNATLNRSALTLKSLLRVLLYQFQGFKQIVRRYVRRGCKKLWISIPEVSGYSIFKSKHQLSSPSKWLFVQKGWKPKAIMQLIYRKIMPDKPFNIVRPHLYNVRKAYNRSQLTNKVQGKLIKINFFSDKQSYVNGGNKSAVKLNLLNRCSTNTDLQLTYATFSGIYKKKSIKGIKKSIRFSNVTINFKTNALKKRSTGNIIWSLTRFGMAAKYMINRDIMYTKTTALESKYNIPYNNFKKTSKNRKRRKKVKRVKIF